MTVEGQHMSHWIMHPLWRMDSFQVQWTVNIWILSVNSSEDGAVCLRILVYTSHSNCGNRIYCNLFTTEEINSQDTDLSRTKENFSLVKDGNLENGKNEQIEDVEQLIKHVNITGEIVIPAGGRIFIVIICTAV